MKTKLAYLLLIVFVSSVISGQKINDFRLKDANNKWQKFTELKGAQLTVIDFWATWCSPCTKALPKLNKLYQTYESKGVQFIGLNVDSPRNSAKVKPFVNAYKIKYPVLKDPNGDLSSKLNIASIPTLLIVNTQNEIIYRHQGYRSGDEKIIEEEIQKFLSKEFNE